MTSPRFDNSYATLPDRFFTRMAPVPVPEPGLVLLNRALAHDLGLDADWLASPEGLAMLAGNTMPAGAEPLAQVYAGHQFGGWSPQLGDGRAILLGEIFTPEERRFDLHLKGAGRTPYSRMGDGRAWLSPVLREYLMSEAMAALGIPTTRALAAVTTGEMIYREGRKPGAILTRIAASHIRVGTFQYFAAREDIEGLKALTAHTIARHYPEAQTALDLLRAVIAAQARLVAQWMGVGFIHGVMNTDNMAISGETIDYGPCAFMDHYHPQRVFSSIDSGGRYAYARQPEMALWNLAQLATALLPLIDEDRKQAVEIAVEAVQGFEPLFQAEWLAVFGAKIGLARPGHEDAALIQDLLGRMATEKADFTNVFRGLADGTARDWFLERAAFDGWAEKWQARLAQEGADTDLPRRLNAANPAFIPRNHRVEAALSAAIDGDMAPFQRLLEITAHPFDSQPENAPYMAPPDPDQAVHRTFCGT